MEAFISFSAVQLQTPKQGRLGTQVRSDSVDRSDKSDIYDRQSCHDRLAQG